ncbi:interactor of constitutive active ROPs 2, chloroplastic-like protein, partial [Tanacetum coccineum]
KKLQELETSLLVEEIKFNSRVKESELEEELKNESAIKVDHLVEEIEKSTRKVARVEEQLEVAQAANYEIEAELRKLKVQYDEWRKAAEAAAAMLSTSSNTNRRLMERTCSMNNTTPGRNIGSPYGEDIDDDEFMKKKKW